MSMSFKKTAIAAAVGTLVLASAPGHATNGYAPHGIGTASKGLAGSGSALPQDSLVMATNPAGIAYVGQRLDVAASVFSPRREYTVEGNPSGFPGTFGLNPRTTSSDSNYFLVPSIGYTAPINADASWGISMYGNGGMNTDYPNFTNPFCPPLSAGTGSFCAGAAGIDLKQIFVTPTYAQKFYGGKVALGASIILGAQQFKATGLGSFAGFSSDPTKLSDNGSSTSTGVGLRIAAMGEVAPGVTLAASLQPEMSMGEFDDYAGLFQDKGNFDIPANWTIGLAWKMTPSAALTLDVQGIQYSSVDTIGNSISVLTTGGQPFGSTGGPGFGWDDQTIIKVGYQWATPNSWTWRVGYSHGSNPIPSSEATLNVLAPAVVEDHFTFGFTKDVGSTNAWNFAAMYAPEGSTKGPNVFEAPGQQTVEEKMYQFDLELGYTWKF
ncbi:MAG: OmpP1/FadL family transporter [bacterium]